MTHNLKFTSIHKSIIGLEEIDLPSFVVLTGVNGSGKTHLLTAIKGGQVSSSIVTNHETDVRLFDSTSIIPTDTGMYDPLQDQSRRSQWFHTITNHREQYFPNLQNFAISLGIPANMCTTPQKIASLSETDLAGFFDSEIKTREVIEQLQTQIKMLGANIANTSFNSIGDDFWRKNAPRVAQTHPEIFMLSSRTDFFRNTNLLWGDVDPFQQAFGQAFVTYRALIHENDRLEKYPPPEAPHIKPLSSEDFVKEYGSPPWDFVNQILEESSLNFRVDSPPLHDIGTYEPKLRKVTSDVEMRFQDLSSGEKVLLSFALCLYNSREVRQTKSFPRLLLLDEVDAPLHPSMAASLLSTIQNVLVKDKNVSVIMTTHSPSTVALAPENAIYAMDPSGPRLLKTSKGEALSLLTTGVPTLSISFSGRRQIFVESRTDASIYDSLYQKYKPKLKSERSLAFVEVGKKNEAGLEQSGGCEQVTRLVTTLSDNGNRSVLGLVDWDGKQIPSPRVHVLSPEIRDGIESLLFDPAIIVALVARENVRHAYEIEILYPNESYVSISDWSSERWQLAVDKLQAITHPTEFKENGSRTSIEYLSGHRLEILTTYLRMDDHALEELLKTKFSFLKARSRRTGELMRHIIDTVLVDFEQLIPIDLLSTFQRLLSVELE
ncbi:hypothetical protein PSCICE_09000 [Pseudomonas cichorii]|nr:ATP-binding protein [Pseudomonas cichorii]GFM49633.1 hypothetical protein PSCICE_09000 [Pseudomonas cichorii]